MAVTDNKLLFAGIGLLVGGLLSLSASAIGTQCYNENEEYGKSKGSNKSFLLFNLIVAIITVVFAVAAIYYSLKKAPAIADIATSTADIATSTADVATSA
jgi:hypothetical protein|uniref:Uncharacterized protein n=1 Tax=viral metagenome TaxID=1070528 RepID=A0A6C0DVS6_9ZZZZ